MNVYGEGQYVEGNKTLEGQIIVDQYKFYLSGPQGDLTQTFVPLEKIEKIRKTWGGIELSVRLSAATGYRAQIKGKRLEISNLITDLTKRLNLKKQFFKNEWVGDVSWR